MLRIMMGGAGGAGFCLAIFNTVILMELGNPNFPIIYIYFVSKGVMYTFTVYYHILIFCSSKLYLKHGLPGYISWESHWHLHIYSVYHYHIITACDKFSWRCSSSKIVKLNRAEISLKRCTEQNHKGVTNDGLTFMASGYPGISALQLDSTFKAWKQG